MAVNKVALGDETLLDLTSDTATVADVAEGKTFHLASGVASVGTASYAAAPENMGNAVTANAILFGRVDSTSTSTAFTATVDGLDSLYDGATVMLRNGVVTSASGFTINVNNLGAKPVYNNLATGNDITPTNPTRDTTIFNINYTMLFVYDSQLVSGGAWICYRGYDGNTNTIGYQVRTNSGRKPAADTGYRYRIWLTSPDGAKWVPINTSSQTNNTTSRSLNTRAIDPFGPIAYNSTNGTCNSGSNLPAATMWRVYTLTIGYSYVKTLTAWDSVYLKCQPQTDGSAVMKDIVQALPSSKDGFIYIHLGTAYSTTAMELQSEHPVYWHDGTGIRLWTGAEPAPGGSTVTVTPSLTSGTQVGSISVDGTSETLYAPTPPTASTAAPSMDGTAAVGSSTNYARADHVHPTDTSRVATSITNNGATTEIRNNGTLADLVYTKGQVLAQIRANTIGADLYAESGSTYSEVLVMPSGVKITNLVTPTTNTMPTPKSYVDTAVSAKQATLVSGTNIKTINGNSLLGSGDLAVGTEYTAGTGISISNGVISLDISSANGVSF